jgi:resuscitation-promoting factor RpfB
VRSRLVVGSVYGVITAALVAGTAAFVGLDKDVTISVDGQVTHVRTYATSVDAVLHRAGIVVGAHDAVTPATSAPVHNGSVIDIARGRPVTLIVDGVSRHAWVTADNVDAALQQVGLRAPDAALSVDRDTRVPLTGMNISVDLPHALTVQVDGAVHSIVSNKPTIAGVLNEAGITLGAADQISADPASRPVDGMAVVIVRMTSGQELQTSAIPFTTTTQPDSALLVGTKKVLRTGENGTLERTYQLVFANGAPTSKTLVSEETTVPAVAQVIGIGTKPKPKPPVYTPAADGLNWKALSDCEAGGRANAVDPPYYGMYQFLASTWRAVGGSGLPSQASAAEQTYRAQLLYKRSNWHSQWPVCGHLLFN